LIFNFPNDQSWITALWREQTIFMKLCGRAARAWDWFRDARADRLALLVERTAALRSKRMALPSGRRIFLAVRTITA